MEELMATAYSAPSDHSNIDPSKHHKMQQPDRNLLTKGAVKLEKTNNFFTGTLPETWRAISVVVFYGMNQNYYLTSYFK